VKEKMEKTIKARFLEGIFKPLEKVELEEGEEVIVTIKEISKETKDAFE
jgi:predicted DNA-binding antitoxin AbrB/MazE fold protein